MTNYTIIDNNLITDLKISDGSYRCYNLLLSMAYGDKTTCYPSIKFLATSLGRCERTINRYIKELVSLGLITKRRRGSISNIYTLLQKKVQRTVERIGKAVNKAKKAYNNHKNNYKNSCTNVQRTDFNNYQQREYNYNNLEAMLLGQMEYNPDLL